MEAQLKTFFFIHFRTRSHTPKLKLFNVPSTQIKITVDFSMRPDPWVGNLVWDLKIDKIFCPLAFCKDRHKLGHNRWFITKTQANNVLNTFTNRHYTAALAALFCKLLRDPSSFCLVIPPSLGCFFTPMSKVACHHIYIPSNRMKEGHTLPFRMQPKVSQITSAHFLLAGT